MQSENFDQRIKDALDQTPPGNENPDWERMEKMLDKHLPQKKKDRRRFFLILFMFLLAGGAGYFVWENGRGNKNEIVSAEQKSTVTDQDKINNESIATKTAPESTTEVSSNTEAITPVQPAKKKSNEPINKSSVVVEKDQDSFNQNIPEKETVQPNEIVIKRNKQKKNPTPAITTNNKKVIEKTTADPVKESFAEKKHEIVAIPQKENDHVISPEKNESTIKETENPQQEEKKITEQTPETKESQPTATAKTGNKKQKSKGSFLNNLFFTASAGPDVSSVGMDKTGKIRLATGVGIGYQVSNKFSIRTGFYSASKVYSADPEDYKPPYNVAQYYPNLKNIDANCKVYEIPVMVDYTISNNKKRSWFVSAGVSSLIMKKETYEYYFKPNYSPTYITYSRTINNENKHYFSQLNFSGGYRMNLNKNFSLQAEPYMKIAMNGVGFGKVNLNSAGILFSAVIKPFAKK